MIELRNVSKTFLSKAGSVQALNNVSLTISKGDIYGIIGFSGAGKSTLIRLVNGLEKPSTGSVIVNSKDITKLSQKELNFERKKIGMVFQQFHLLNSKTVYDNIAIPLVLNKTPKHEIQKQVDSLLAFVNLEDKRDAYPDQLSGGQKQRVGIARALATNPDILLCDEATSALDPKTTSSILQLLKKINVDFGITILMITHEMNVIKDICHHVAVMNDGVVVETGSVESVFGDPQSKVAQNFLRNELGDSIPVNLLERMKANTSSSYIHLKLSEQDDSGALLAILNKKFGVETHIVMANISEWRSVSIGTMVLEIKGSLEARNQVFRYLETTTMQWEKVN